MSYNLRSIDTDKQCHPPLCDVYFLLPCKRRDFFGSGCGSVGRAVTSDTKGPLFKCSHLLNFIPNMYLQLTVELDDHEEKQAVNGLFIKDI